MPLTAVDLYVYCYLFCHPNWQKNGQILEMQLFDTISAVVYLIQYKYWCWLLMTLVDT